jgi:hypothetical protein
MDFVEKLFHVSPDGGNGAYEALIVVLIGFLALGGVLIGHVHARSSRKNRAEKK